LSSNVRFPLLADPRTKAILAPFLKKDGLAGKLPSGQPRTNIPAPFASHASKIFQKSSQAHSPTNVSRRRK
jgi:hypothetical protein